MDFTLHNTTEFMKRFGIGSAIGVVGIIVLVIFFNIGVAVKNILFPPKIEPANQAYGPLPPIAFPEDVVPQVFTYTVDTLDGTLPTFPDRLTVYPIVNESPNLLNLETVKDRVRKLGFVTKDGQPLAEIPQGGSLYEWQETEGIQRDIIYDIVGLDFTLTSEYLRSLIVLNARNLENEAAAVGLVERTLSVIDSFEDDIDLESTLSPDPENTYRTEPQLFSITNGELVPSTSLSRAHVIRVDLYQKNITYDLTAGTENDLTKFKDFEMDVPIMYPNPPYSTMNFLIASGKTSSEIVSAIYSYQQITREPEETATYPIKTADEAFAALQDGNAYIAAYSGNADQVFINKVYLGYYLGQEMQEYLLPVIVFEGSDGFFAYVPALREQVVE